MALSAQLAPTASLVDFVEYAKANGYRITEMPPYDGVAPGVHNPRSFHYDKDGKYGLAADINIGAAGASDYEMRMLKRLIPVAQSLGLGVILAAYGTNVVGHRDHMHVDVGSYSNLGRGTFRQAAGHRRVIRTQKALHQYRSKQDNLLGGYTRDDLTVLRAASRKGGFKFPLGVKRAQRVVGVKQTGKWDRAAGLAHTETVKTLQRVWKAYGYYTGEIDGIWGNMMDTARYKFLKSN